MKTTDTEALRR